MSNGYSSHGKGMTTLLDDLSALGSKQKDDSPYKFENVSSSIEIHICVKINGHYETFNRFNHFTGAKWYRRTLSGDSSIVTNKHIISYLDEKAKTLARKLL